MLNPLCFNADGVSDARRTGQTKITTRGGLPTYVEELASPVTFKWTCSYENIDDRVGPDGASGYEFSSKYLIFVALRAFFTDEDFGNLDKNAYTALINEYIIAAAETYAAQNAEIQKLMRNAYVTNLITCFRQAYPDHESRLDLLNETLDTSIVLSGSDGTYNDLAFTLLPTYLMTMRVMERYQLLPSFDRYHLYGFGVVPGGKRFYPFESDTATYSAAEAVSPRLRVPGILQQGGLLHPERLLSVGIPASGLIPGLELGIISGSSRTLTCPTLLDFCCVILNRFCNEETTASSMRTLFAKNLTAKYDNLIGLIKNPELNYVPWADVILAIVEEAIKHLQSTEDTSSLLAEEFVKNGYCAFEGQLPLGSNGMNISQLSAYLLVPMEDDPIATPNRAANLWGFAVSRALSIWLPKSPISPVFNSVNAAEDFLNGSKLYQRPLLIVRPMSYSENPIVAPCAVIDFSNGVIPAPQNESRFTWHSFGASLLLNSSLTHSVCGSGGQHFTTTYDDSLAVNDTPTLSYMRMICGSRTTLGRRSTLSGSFVNCEANLPLIVDPGVLMVRKSLLGTSSDATLPSFTCFWRNPDTGAFENFIPT